MNLIQLPKKTFGGELVPLIAKSLEEAFGQRGYKVNVIEGGFPLWIPSNGPGIDPIPKRTVSHYLISCSKPLEEFQGTLGPVRVQGRITVEPFHERIKDMLFSDAFNVFTQYEVLKIDNSGTKDFSIAEIHPRLLEYEVDASARTEMFAAALYRRIMNS